MSHTGIEALRIRGFRSAHDLLLRPRAVCALVGEAGVGKSNVLAAVWMLLDQAAPKPSSGDVTFGGGGLIDLSARFTDGRQVELHASPPGVTHRSGPAIEVAFLPAGLRAGALTASSGTALSQRIRRGAATRGHGRSAVAVALVSAVERLCTEATTGSILLIEEPELYLRPQAQRFLYRLLRSFAEAGNQVFYSTHAPAFLNVAHLEELALVAYHPQRGTAVLQPPPLPRDERFRALSEFDAERSELFLSRAALLVEGRTEKLVFPFVFRALGADPDREAISIVECGGKPIIPVVARVCAAAGIPFVVVHDRDADTGREPIMAEQAVNREILAVAGPDRVVQLVPDFERIAGLHGHSHKPEHAMRRFAHITRAQVPTPLADAVLRVLSAAGA